VIEEYPRWKYSIHRLIEKPMQALHFALVVHTSVSIGL